MIDMEQRALISINRFPPVADEETWAPFISALERSSSDYGPILAWEARDVGQVLMSADVDDRAQFARAAIVCVTEALQAAGLRDLYPTAIEIEPADDPAAVA